MIDLLGLPHLYHFSRIHYVYPICITGNDTQIMGNHNQGHAELSSQLLHQLENLCLNGDIQCSRWLISNNQLWVTTQRQCDHHPLPHPTG